MSDTPTPANTETREALLAALAAGPPDIDLTRYDFGAVNRDELPPAPAPPGGDDGTAAGARFALRNTVGAHDPEAVAYVAGLIRARDAALSEAARARAEVEAWGAFVAVDCPEGHQVAIDDGDGGTYTCPLCALATARAENARLAAALGRVEGLCEKWEAIHEQIGAVLGKPPTGQVQAFARELRAAAAGTDETGGDDHA